MTVTVAPTCARGSASFVAVTTTGSVSRSSCAVAGTGRPGAMTATDSTIAESLRTASLLVREGLEALPGARFPDSWIVALRPCLPIPTLSCARDSGSALAEQDGAPHSQWRDRAGLGPSTSPASLNLGRWSHACPGLTPFHRGVGPQHLDQRAARRRVASHGHGAAIDGAEPAGVENIGRRAEADHATVGEQEQAIAHFRGEIEIVGHE